MTDQPTYEALLAEVKRLRVENAELKKRLGIPDMPPKRQLSGSERIALFMSLFSGRQDVYANQYCCSGKTIHSARHASAARKTKPTAHPNNFLAYLFWW